MKHFRPAISPVSRRPRTPAHQRERWVRAWEGSQLTQSEFAQTHGLRLATFRNWVRQRGRSTSDAPGAPVAFEEFPIQEVLGSMAEAGGQPWEVEIRLPSGPTIAIARGTPAARIRELVEAVRC